MTDSQGRGDTGAFEESGSGWGWEGSGWGGDTRSFGEHNEMEEHGRTGEEDKSYCLLVPSCAWEIFN